MNSNKVFPGVWLMMAIWMVFAITMIIPVIAPGVFDFSAAQLINDSFLCHQDQPETNVSTKLLISCDLDGVQVQTSLVDHQFQVNILLNGWDWKIDQIIWEIPRS